jgi:hypothetical protein
MNNLKSFSNFTLENLNESNMDFIIKTVSEMSNNEIQNIRIKAYSAGCPVALLVRNNLIQYFENVETFFFRSYNYITFKN